MRVLPTSTSLLAVGWKNLSPVVIAEANVTRIDGLTRVPYYGLDGRDVNAKLFSEKTGRSWWERRGVGVLPSGMERLPRTEFDEWFALVLEEGEADALRLCAGPSAFVVTGRCASSASPVRVRGGPSSGCSSVASRSSTSSVMETRPVGG